MCANGLIVPDRENLVKIQFVCRSKVTQSTNTFTTHTDTEEAMFYNGKRSTCPCTLAALSMGSTLTSSPPTLHDTAPNLHA